MYHYLSNAYLWPLASEGIRGVFQNFWISLNFSKKCSNNFVCTVQNNQYQITTTLPVYDPSANYLNIIHFYMYIVNDSTLKYIGHVENYQTINYCSSVTLQMHYICITPFAHNRIYINSASTAYFHYAINLQIWIIYK